MRLNSRLENDLQSTFGCSHEEIEALVREKRNMDFLNRYRWAFSLWAEYTQDTKLKIIASLDWRDTAGKWSNIKRVTEYFNTKRFTPYAFEIPTPEERFEDNWFQRYADCFPDEWKLSFFDRSWYNRAFVEPAMGFCTEQEYNWFMENVWKFEKERIIDQDIELIKIYLSINKPTQKERLVSRDTKMKWWKSSQVDQQAQEKWNYYTLAKKNVLEQTDFDYAPWLVIDSNKKFLSSSEIIKHIISRNKEVKKLIESQLDIDLSPNPKITRSGAQELKRMHKNGELDRAKNGFQFK